MREMVPLPIRRALGGAWSRGSAAVQKRLLLFALSGNKVECNVCGWHGRKFASDVWHKGTICPQCRTQVRHRLLVATLNGLSREDGLTAEKQLAGRDILHFAPERQLRQKIKDLASRYVTADFDRGDVDWRLDISAMPIIRNHEFDVIIACDILEHVVDDHRALQEIHRILRPGGLAILTVPQKDPPARTDEDPTITDEGERERRFGQKDHVRMYGDDFVDRVRSAGFSVTAITADSFSAEDQKRFGLRPPVLSPNPLATNHRTIYFCFA